MMVFMERLLLVGALVVASRAESPGLRGANATRAASRDLASSASESSYKTVTGIESCRGGNLNVGDIWGTGTYPAKHCPLIGGLGSGVVQMATDKCDAEINCVGFTYYPSGITYVSGITHATVVSPPKVCFRTNVDIQLADPNSEAVCYIKPKTTTTTTTTMTTTMTTTTTTTTKATTYVTEGTIFIPSVLYSSHWYPICGHYFWDNNNGATKICQKLGFQTGEVIKQKGPYLTDAMPVGRCGPGQDLLDCSKGGNSWGKLHQRNGWCNAGKGVGVHVSCKGGSMHTTTSCQKASPLVVVPEPTPAPRTLGQVVQLKNRCETPCSTIQGCDLSQCSKKGGACPWCSDGCVAPTQQTQCKCEAKAPCKCLELQTCDASNTNQHWVVTSNGQLKHSRSGLCMRIGQYVDGVNTAPSNNALQWVEFRPCHEGEGSLVPEYSDRLNGDILWSMGQTTRTGWCLGEGMWAQELDEDGNYREDKMKLYVMGIVDGGSGACSKRMTSSWSMPVVPANAMEKDQDDLPTFSNCEEAKEGILKLPRSQRWEYDCAKICYWPCGGNCVCDCPNMGGAFPGGAGPRCFALKPHVKPSTASVEGCVDGDVMIAAAS